MTEWMDIVNDSNEVIGTTTQEEIYAKKLTHRIAHVFVINPATNEIYLQKRAESKGFMPGHYCTSAGGHVQAGETYETAAARELQEELGVSVPLQDVGSLEFVSSGHKRMIRLFLAYATKGFTHDANEVAGGQFFSFERARELIEQGEKIHPQLRECFWMLCKDMDFVN